MDSNAVPELRDELERKTVETLDWIVQQHATGQMSMPQAKVACQSVFNVASGLVSGDVMSAITGMGVSSMANELIRHVFVDFAKNAVFVVQWRVGDEHVDLIAKTATDQRTKQYLQNTPAEARAHMELLCATLSARGAQEIS